MRCPLPRCEALGKSSRKVVKVGASARISTPCRAELSDDGAAPLADEQLARQHDLVRASQHRHDLSIERYQLQHQAPFSAGLRNIDFNSPVLLLRRLVRLAQYAHEPGGRIRGVTGAERTTEMRVVDMCRREG